MIVAAGRAIIKGETSPEKAERVRKLFVDLSAVRYAKLTPWLF